MRPLSNLRGPLRRALKASVVLYSRFVLQFRAPYGYIFILSHMRAGSSLLAHLLIANPEIRGYGETHTQFVSLSDFTLLVAKVAYALGDFPLLGKERLVLDKVLHNGHIPLASLSLFSEVDAKVIFLIREPQSTIASLRKHLDYSERRAVDYYVSRLTMLGNYAQQLYPQKQPVVIRYDQILNETERVFVLLEDYLALAHPLQERYDTLATTGMRGVGDISVNIQAGEILRRKNDTPQALSREYRSAVQDAYEKCLNLLSMTCRTIHD